jgi:hypothetical protein
MITNIPKLTPISITIGYNGIDLCGEDRIEENQVGYSISSSGVTFVGANNGDWKNEWVVIGRETCCGDPIFIDTSIPEFPVYTAVHGEGCWSPALISSSYRGLLKITEQLAVLAKGREYPKLLESKPMTQNEYDEFLRQVTNQGELENSLFWAQMISDVEAEVGIYT